MEHSTDPLTEEERKEVRKMLEADRRARWLWASIRTWAAWIVAIVGGMTLLWDTAIKALKKIAGG